MADDPIAFLLDMFGVSVKEIYPGHKTFVPVDYLSDQKASKLAKEDVSAARFIRARLGGQIGGGRPRPRPRLYRLCARLTRGVRLGKQAHPNNPYLRTQAEALKTRFGINIKRYDDGVAACDYIAEAEAIRWPKELARDIENLSVRQSHSVAEMDLNTDGIRTLALKNRAGTINTLISKG